MAFIDSSKSSQSSLLTQATSKSATTQPIKVIDVSDEPAKANVVREGVLVPTVTLNQAALDEFLRPDDIVEPRQAPRVVSQSIKAGIKIEAGTQVDVVLAPRDATPVDIITGFHQDASGRTMDEISNEFLGDETIRNAVLTFDNAQDIPESTRDLIVETAGGADIGVTEDDSSRNFNSLILTLKGAAAYE